MDGVTTHGSSFGVGYMAPSWNAWLPIRQMSAGPSCASPAVLKPAACSSAYPDGWSIPQPRTIGPPQRAKSTATIVPRADVKRSGPAARQRELGAELLVLLDVGSRLSPGGPWRSPNAAGTRSADAVTAVPADAAETACRRVRRLRRP